MSIPLRSGAGRPHCANRPAVAGRAARGFTLVEMLVVFAIGAIVMALGLPSFRGLVEGVRIEDAYGSLRATLDRARSEALARGTRVGVCRSVDAGAATPACSAEATAFGARDWAAGWLLYAKGGGNVGAVFEPGDALVGRQPALAPAGRSNRVQVWSPTADVALVYNVNGMRVAGPMGVFAIDHGVRAGAPPATLASPRARCVNVNVVGRLDVFLPRDGTCR